MTTLFDSTSAAAVAARARSSARGRPLFEGSDDEAGYGGFVMAAREDAADALYSAIALQAKAFETEAASESKAAAIRQLAEAFAWLNSPNQPH